jgi:hypothetical protein
MSIAQETAALHDAYRISVGGQYYTGLPGTVLAERGAASKRVISAYGFWIFLL